MASTMLSSSAGAARRSAAAPSHPFILEELRHAADVGDGFIRWRSLGKVIALGDYGLLWLAYLLGQGRIQ
jgi:hypothetical protein